MGWESTDLVISISQNQQFGDYSTNIALQLAKQKKENGEQSARDIANSLIEPLQHIGYIEKVEVAGPGFINFFIKDQVLIKEIFDKAHLKPEVRESSKILVEYAQPNTHKAFHIGHLRNICLGESIARMLEFQGNTIFRATYGSDIGLPVAKAIWGVQQLDEEFKAVKDADLKTKAEFLGKAYAFGASKYEEPQAKEAIDRLNKAIYARDPELVKLWQETKQWSLDYFDTIYKRLGTQFDRVFCESEVEALGRKTVEEHIGEIFIYDQGAVVFPGEQFGLHTRVFLTSAGNPTYEAKELGLAEAEYQAFPYDQSLHVVGNEQNGYFQVIMQVLDLIFTHLVGKKKHITYGMVNLPSGKMSSRKGDVITADWVFDQVKEQLSQVMADSNLKNKDHVLEQVTVGAVKYAMLKYAASADFAFDIAKSISVQGDSGPYLQYTYARTQSVLAKEHKLNKDAVIPAHLEPEERAVLRSLMYLPEMVQLAAHEYKPNILAEYLIEVAKVFNLFYQRHRIIESDQKAFRLQLTAAVAESLKKGLELLGIEAPQQM